MKATASMLWRSGQNLVLASRSKARLTMLRNAGIPVDAAPADIDERGIQARRGSGLNPEAVAALLARAKALAASAKMPGRLVLAADQTLDVDGATCAKVSGRAEAEERLRLLSGREHTLHSAYCFARDGAILRAGAARARLSVRTISETFIAAYLDAAGAAIFDSVAVYEIEGLGIQLFDRIDGDWFTIQGLPLDAVVAFLRDEGLLLR